MLKFGSVAVAATLTVVGTTVAEASGPGGCTSSGMWGQCWVSATDPGRPSGPAGPGNQQAGGHQGATGSPGAPAISCSNQAWTPPPAGDPLWGGHSPSQGKLNFQLCQGGGAAQPWPRVVFAPNGQPIVVPQVSPAQLAQQAIAAMGLSAPDIQLAPPADSPHGATIGFPVWMWTRRTEATTGPVTRTAAAGPIAVTATARLARINWAMGDGSTVPCAGPGTPFTDDRAGQSSPTCGHVYDRKAADGSFAIAATSHWEISWSGGGQSDFQTMDLTSQARLPIREIRTLNTGAVGG